MPLKVRLVLYSFKIAHPVLIPFQLAVAGDNRRYVFQGVHMVFTGHPGKEWPNSDEQSAGSREDQGRMCQLVMIGRNLPLKELESGFRSCLATEEARKGRESLVVG